jgi:hypothetical protein
MVTYHSSQTSVHYWFVSATKYAIFSIVQIQKAIVIFSSLSGKRSNPDYISAMFLPSILLSVIPPKSRH